MAAGKCRYFARVPTKEPFVKRPFYHKTFFPKGKSGSERKRKKKEKEKERKRKIHQGIGRKNFTGNFRRAERALYTSLRNDRNGTTGTVRYGITRYVRGHLSPRMARAQIYRVSFASAGVKTEIRKRCSRPAERIRGRVRDPTPRNATPCGYLATKFEVMLDEKFIGVRGVTPRVLRARCY